MKNKIVELYKSGMPIVKICQELRYSKDTVRKALIGVAEFKLPKEDVCKLIILDYVNGQYRVKPLCKKYKISMSTLHIILDKYDIPMTRRKTKINENFFKEIDTERKAYWLGFFMADGYNDEVKNRIEITLKDKQPIEDFKRDIETEHKIATRCIGGKDYYRLYITSKPMSEDLAKHGCVQRKSLILEFPNIPKELTSHFIRGYFDGDGSVCCNNDKKVYSFHLLGTASFLESCRMGMNMHHTKLGQKGKAYDLRFGGRKNLEILYDYLYKDATIYLERKQKEFVRCKLLPS